MLREPALQSLSWCHFGLRIVIDFGARRIGISSVPVLSHPTLSLPTGRGPGDGDYRLRAISHGIARG